MRLKATLRLGLYLCMAVGLASCSDAKHREAHYLERGKDLFAKGEYEKARLEFKNAGRIAPTDPEVRYRIGLVEESEGDLRAAFISQSLAVDQDAHYLPAILKLTSYYLLAGDLESGEKHLKVAIADHPDDPETRALHGSILLKQGKLDQALGEASYARRVDPANVTATSVLTGTYLAMNNTDKALEALEFGIAHNKSDASLLQLKIAVFDKLDDFPKLAQAYEEYFAVRPTEIAQRVEFANRYIKRDQKDDAERVLRDGVKANPTSNPMKLELVKFLSTQRGLDPAEAEVRSYIKQYPDMTDYYFWLADVYVQHNAADRAEALLNELVSIQGYEPPGLTARASLAQLSLKRGDIALAEKLLALVLQRDPSNMNGLFIRANIEFSRGQNQAVVGDLRAILRDHPRHALALQLLSEALLLQGRLDLAIDTLSHLVDIEPLEPGVRVRLAQLYQVRNDTARALETLQLVTKANPDYPVAWETVARIAIERRDWAAANDAISTLAKISGQELTAAFLRGEAEGGAGKFDDALVQLHRVVEADSSAPLAEHALQALVSLHRKQGQLAALAQYLNGVPSSPFVRTTIAECYMELGRIDEASAELDKLLAAKPQRAAPYLDRARIFISQGAKDKAVDVLKQGLDAVPGDAQIPMFLADLLGAIGRYQEAISLYDQLLERDPSRDRAANNLAELVADFLPTDARQLEHAGELAERFQSSKNPYFLDTLGWVYYRQGKYNQAQGILLRAASMEDATPQVHYHLGMLLLSTGRKAQAKAELASAVNSPRAYPGLDEAKKLYTGL